jgi:hypothetical protein
VDLTEHSVRDLVSGLVLPCVYHAPASVREHGVDAAVPGDVALQLGLPIADVAGRDIAVYWARMPEAPVDEDSDPPSRKHHVCTHSKIVKPNGIINSKPSPSRMEH